MFFHLAIVESVRLVISSLCFNSNTFGNIILTVHGLPRATHVIAIAFSAMMILVLVSIVVHWFMRIRVMRLDSANHRIEWLSFRSGDDVVQTYAALFPRSLLPRVCLFVCRTAIIIAAVGLCAIAILKASGR